MRTYIVQSRDTLGKIAKQFYDDATLSQKLADYNGLRDPNQIVVGQALKIPSLREMEGEIQEPSPSTLGLQPPASSLHRACRGFSIPSAISMSTSGMTGLSIQGGKWINSLDHPCLSRSRSLGIVRKL